MINLDAIELMRSIKDDGNRASHKYDSGLTMDQFRAMSAKSTQDFCILIRALNITLYGDFSTFIFEPKVDSYLEKLSYKAVFDNEAEAKFKVGLALIEQVITNWNGSNPSMTDDGKIGRGIKWIEDAANQQHLEAKFEFGVMLSEGKYVEKSIAIH